MWAGIRVDHPEAASSTCAPSRGRPSGHREPADLPARYRVLPETTGGHPTLGGIPLFHAVRGNREIDQGLVRKIPDASHLDDVVFDVIFPDAVNDKIGAPVLLEINPDGRT
jgi:hypothetical protein